MYATELRFEIVLVFFVYGLAFFSMGLAMFMEARRTPILAEGRALRPLAFFGIVHGFHEWLETAIEVRAWFDLVVLTWWPWVRLAILIISFISLVLFALQSFRPKDFLPGMHNAYISLGLFFTYLLLVFSTSVAHPSSAGHWLEHADALARYTLAVPAAMLAGLALNRRAQAARAAISVHLQRSLQLAALGFFFYGLSQVVVPPVDFFPGRYLNTQTFFEFAGVPVQAGRAVMAVLVTLGLIRAAQLTEDERQRQFILVQEARLEAMQQVQRELAEREAMRRELLRHTVIAQEDERARIARELHDETSQFLTALSLDLATLRRMLARNREAAALLERLQDLSAQMSLGIYRMVHDLRPAQLDDLGLAAALQYLVDEARRKGLEVSLEITGVRQRLDPLVETVLFRVAQEGLTNVIRHAHCANAQASLAIEASQARLRIQDDGKGFAPAQVGANGRGWGLAGMRERVESLGGQFSIHSSPGAGCALEVLVPFIGSESLSMEADHDERHSLNVG
ncbi:MAG: sensor histidine kinase [Chloroflexi bacterium]|nr:sensor histidine kinase [Chloroflexota bacterium]